MHKTLMKKKLTLPKLKISVKSSNSALSTPYSTKRSNTPQVLSPYSATSLNGRASSRPQGKRKSRFGMIRTFQKNSIDYNKMQMQVKPQCESPRKFSTISTVSTTIPQQQESQEIEPDPQFELKYSSAITINHPDLEFIFNEKHQENDENYYKEGNAKFYTEEMKLARQQLKQSPAVISCIQRFISDCFSFNDEGLLSKQNYFQIFFRISCILRPNLYKTAKFKDMKQVLDNDWIHDTKGKNQYSINKEDLFDSIWELIDIWTPDVNEQLYIGFLETLKMKFILPLWNLGETTDKKISIYDIM